MKIEITAEEAAIIITDFIAKTQRMYEKGAFALDWKIAAATGQPSILVGATVTLQAAKPEPAALDKENTKP